MGVPIPKANPEVVSGSRTVGQGVSQTFEGYENGGTPDNAYAVGPDEQKAA
ncbi:MAG: hypothetical protein ABJQ14_08700 [Hyphomicrobiales bacterium]